ncbi:hypothetical protein M6B38_339205 [Iris pallida]|uniref:Uncharacterized protein n=1 Tax=Iris pallida TaxID=29817 RepID=A0AAX6F1E0_IRIPA|nr:hypothetical protein M6B38_159470 [Iris pallida]KAJ6833863.1 hypothetical protein M6B38_339200 [Iris pallida]KAJ6833864.1 hypothetical protein M6B38_339205 [Iris pallida]
MAAETLGSDFSASIGGSSALEESARSDLEEDGVVVRCSVEEAVDVGLGSGAVT